MTPLTHLFLILLVLLCGESSPNYKSANFSLVVMAPHKSATMLLFNYFLELSKRVGAEFVSPNDPGPNKQNESELMDKYLLLSPPKIFAPYRTFRDISAIEIMTTEKQYNFIFQYRDPLDLVISEYFSFGFTHVPPSKGDPRYETFYANRKRTQDMSIEMFIWDHIAHHNKYYYELISFMDKVGCRMKIIYYDFLVNKTAEWNNDIAKHLSLPRNISKNLFEILPPGAIKGLSHHIHNPEGHGKERLLSTEFIEDYYERLEYFTSALRRHNTKCHAAPYFF